MFIYCLEMLNLKGFLTYFDKLYSDWIHIIKTLQWCCRVRGATATVCRARQTHEGWSKGSWSGPRKIRPFSGYLLFLDHMIESLLSLVVLSFLCLLQCVRVFLICGKQQIGGKNAPDLVSPGSLGPGPCGLAHLKLLGRSSSCNLTDDPSYEIWVRLKHDVGSLHTFELCSEIAVQNMMFLRKLSKFKNSVFSCFINSLWTFCSHLIKQLVISDLSGFCLTDAVSDVLHLLSFNAFLHGFSTKHELQSSSLKAGVVLEYKTNTFRMALCQTPREAESCSSTYPQMVKICLCSISVASGKPQLISFCYLMWNQQLQRSVVLKLNNGAKHEVKPFLIFS